MATDILPERPVTPVVVDEHDRMNRAATWPVIRQILMPLASLKLTVVLFALSIVLVFAGTLAQVERDIWEVMNLYFRAYWVRIPFQIFFPPAFFTGPPPVVPGGFWFPGGFIIGGAMFVNLLAAHALRFTVQAHGTRLMAGLGVIAAGIALAWVVALGGSNRETIQGLPSIEWSSVWGLFKVCLAGLWVWTAYGLWRLEPHRKLERWLLTSGGLILGAVLCWLVFKGEAAMPSQSALRVLWQLLIAGLPAAVLLAGSYMVFRKRAGIVVLHAGVGLLMLNELVVYKLHEEGSMRIQEGQTVNFVEDIRKLELAVIHSGAPDTEDVVVVPGSMIRGSDVIVHEELPFDVKPVQFFQNSALVELKESKKDNPATEGAGLRYRAEELRPGSGVDTGGKVDLSSAYVQLVDKESGKDLGTYLIGLELNPQQVTVGDKNYDLALRFKRVYKDYYVNLIDFRKDDYLGTNTPKNFSADIRLVDPTRNVDREVKIWMNNPLRFAGDTIYQSSWDPQARIDTTILQVVKNTGWMIPYLACMIVGFGLTFQFLLTLDRFTRRRSDLQSAALALPNKKAARRLDHDEPSSRWLGWVPALVVCAIAGLWIAGKARTPSAASEQFDLYEFGQLPVVYEGRVKPLDTLARNSLRVISDREHYEDADGDKQPAIRWLLDVIARPEEATKHKVFRIHNLEVLDLLGLERRKYYRYAISEFREKIPELEKQLKQVRELDAEQWTVFQRKLLELEKKLGVFMTLSNAFAELPLSKELTQEQMIGLLQSQQQVMRMAPPPLVIPATETEAQWQPYWQAWAMAWLQTNLPGMPGTANAAVQSMDSMLAAYAKNKPDDFNRELTTYQKVLEKNAPSDLNTDKTSFEAFFNHFSAFSAAQWLYFGAFVLTAISWLGFTRPLNRAGFWLIALTFAVHTFALIARIYISGRPPVTNLYTTAIFIGWGCVLLGMILEVVYGMGIGNIVSSVIGFSTLMIADKLAGDGDTFTVLQAVLDTQFWLATHVTTINLGYGTTLIAGLLGCVYVIQGVLTPSLSPKMSKELARMIYGTVCFSLLFSFIGTVLGGLWADDSWGRFWGWDPKENGALLIVIWNALVLHARWGAMIKERGLAVLAIIGNVFVSWSWFGVNELGIGLHSYGFTEGVLKALAIFIGTQLAIVGLGLIPKHLWWSTRNSEAAAMA